MTKRWKIFEAKKKGMKKYNRFDFKKRKKKERRRKEKRKKKKAMRFQPFQLFLSLFSCQRDTLLKKKKEEKKRKKKFINLFDP